MRNQKREKEKMEEDGEWKKRMRKMIIEMRKAIRKELWREEL